MTENPHIYIHEEMDRVPEWDPMTGAHFWTAVLYFHVKRPSQVNDLGEDALVKVVGPVCYHCERYYADPKTPSGCSGRRSRES